MALKIIRQNSVQLNTVADAEIHEYYRDMLTEAAANGLQSIIIPLAPVDECDYPKEVSLRIAVDSIREFLETYDMQVSLMVPDDSDSRNADGYGLGLDEYINRNFVPAPEFFMPSMAKPRVEPLKEGKTGGIFANLLGRKESVKSEKRNACVELREDDFAGSLMAPSESYSALCETEEYDYSKLDERMAHIKDTFSQYLLYLIESKGMTNAEVYNRAIIDKKVFSKIKNNPDYHPQKLTAMCLCVGARLNLDETRDLLARAGYALSPCDKTDIIFQYFIENEIYDMIELDIQLEEHDLPCIIA